MWNLISSNRILDLKQKQQAHIRHLRALKNVKSKINNSQPRRFSFLDYKAKAIQQAKQKTSEIEYANNILVNRMITMPSNLQRLQDVYFKESLNSGLIRKREAKIDRENQKIIKRLQNAHSQYSQKAMSRSISTYQRAKISMSSSKMDQYYDFQPLRKSGNSYQQFQYKSLKGQARPFSAKK